MCLILCFLDKHIAPHITKENFDTHKGDVFIVMEEKVRHNPELTDAWSKLFPECTNQEFLVTLLQETITPYIHVRCDQFRKDMISQMRDKKTLEIRKAVWEGGKGGKRKKSTLSKAPKKAVGRKPNQTPAVLQTLSVLYATYNIGTKMSG